MFGMEIPVQQGWQCPVCGRVYSPTTDMCLYCGNLTLQTTSELNVVVPKRREYHDCLACSNSFSDDGSDGSHILRCVMHGDEIVDEEQEACKDFN